MAHTEQKRFLAIVARYLGNYFTRCSVLEIGSLDITGSARDYFHKCQYLGLDVAAGKGVDIVCQAQEYTAPSNSFDHVLSCEVMEHNPQWAATFLNMVRLCKPGGLVLMTCATTGRAEHGTSRTSAEDSPLTVKLGWEYYRNLAREDFEGIINFAANFSQYHFWTNRYSHDLYFCGIKAGKAGINDAVWEKLIKKVAASTSTQISQQNYLATQIITNTPRSLRKRALRKLMKAFRLNKMA